MYHKPYKNPFAGVHCERCAHFIKSDNKDNRFGYCRRFDRTVFVKYGCFPGFQNKRGMSTL